MFLSLLITFQSLWRKIGHFHFTESYMSYIIYDVLKYYVQNYSSKCKILKASINVRAVAYVIKGNILLDCFICKLWKLEYFVFKTYHSKFSNSKTIEVILLKHYDGRLKDQTHKNSTRAPISNTASPIQWTFTLQTFMSLMWTSISSKYKFPKWAKN